MLLAPVVTAHQGGWDEALMLLTPVALLVALVWAATVRARNAEHHEGDGSSRDR